MEEDKISLKTSPVIIKFSNSVLTKEEDDLNASQTLPDETDTMNTKLFPSKGTKSQKLRSHKAVNNLSSDLNQCAEKNSRTNASDKKRPIEPISFRIVKKRRHSLTTQKSKLSTKKLDIVRGGDESRISKLSKSPHVNHLSNCNPDDLLDVGNGKGGIQKYEASFSSENQQSSSNLGSTFERQPSADNSSSESCNLYDKKIKKLVCPLVDQEPPSKKLKCSLIKNEVLTNNSVKANFSNNSDTKCNQGTSEFNEIPKLPLVMQSSNLLSDNVLDVGHDRGGIKSSGENYLTSKEPSLTDNNDNSTKHEKYEENINTFEHKNYSVEKNNDSISDNVEPKKFKSEKSLSGSQLDSNDSFIYNFPPQNESKESKLHMSPQHTTKNEDFFNAICLKVEPEETELKKSVSVPELYSDEHISNFQTSEVKLEKSEFKESSVTPLSVSLSINNTDSQNKSQSTSDILLSETNCDNKSSIIIQSTDKSIEPLLSDVANEDNTKNPDLNHSSPKSLHDQLDFTFAKNEESNQLAAQNDLSLNKSLCQPINDHNLNESLDCPESKKTSNPENISEVSQNDDSCSNQLDTQASDEPSMVFDILDEFESNENDPEEMDSGGNDSDISADEIDAMLEAGLGDYSKRGENDSNLDHEEKEKVILKVRGRDHFDVLPEGWIEVTHNSGMPIYLHKQSRVCCVSKPYFLGPGSTRKHEIPLSAIPCLHYLKQLEKEKEDEEEEKQFNMGNKTTSFETNAGATEENSLNSGETAGVEKGNTVPSDANKVSENPNVQGIVFPSAKLQSVKDLKLSGSLDYLAVREYCKKRFEFQTITVKRFKTWSGRRQHQKLMKRKQRPFLPDSTKLITCPLPSSADKSTTVGNVSKREFIMNPTGKSPVCILHEYVQHTLRVQPKYIFKELESASTPYGAVVIINDMEYGTGYGSSKKVAKSEAAKSALEVLIPKIKKFTPDNKNSDDDDELQDVEFFDQVRVEDPRVCDLSVKAGQPYPYQILLECLKRNYGMGDTEVSIRMQNLKHQKNEFVMNVGKHSATVVCKNKRDGKQRASQSILQQLHPHINSWGSLLRMYGKGSCKTLKEKKEEEQRITELQTKACANKPNMSILNKLKEEMLKYREKMKSKKPIGKLIPERMQILSVSDSNLKNIEL